MPLKLNEEALLNGIMLGDGCLVTLWQKSGKRSYRIIITLGKREKNLLGKLSVRLLKKLDPNSNPKIRLRKECNAIEVRVSSKIIYNFMKNRWKFCVGKKNNIKIPNMFLKSWKITRQVICGFFATDGTIIFAKQHKKIPYYPRIEFSNNSNVLLNQLKNIFIKRGYKLSRWSNKLSIHGFESAKKFRKEIKFINSNHINRARSFHAHLN